MNDWTITIEAVGTSAGTVDADQLELFAEKLGDCAPIVTGTPESSDVIRCGVTLSASAVEPELGARVLDAANGAGINVSRVVRFDAVASDELDRELDRIDPEYAGIAEIAALLGVNRQRASMLQTRQGFPQPVARLKSGPVWLLRDIDAFRSTWTRAPGRPRKPVTA